jgi:hypothetical protein
MPPTRKRASAFEDFPIEPVPESEAGSPPGVLPGARPAGQPQPMQMERIERLPPSQMMPDRFQPRRLLPASIRAAFFSGQIDCYQAAEAWLKMARTDSAVHMEVERLLQMGESFSAHGQIKPITGAWVPARNGQFIFQIETGERRFWAACLRSVGSNAAEEPLLRVEVVQNPTRQRQVLENRHAEPPSAVEQACEVAALILAELGLEPDPNQTDEYDYFRLARSQRMPVGLWEKITPVMQLTRPRMVQLLNILQLPSYLLDLADRYRLPERVLREILNLPRDQWERMLKVSIQNQLTSDEVQEAAAQPGGGGAKGEHREPQPIPDPSRSALRFLKRFANTLADLDEVSRAQALDDIAGDLIVSRQGEGILNLLEELGRAINTRLSRMG